MTEKQEAKFRMLSLIASGVFAIGGFLLTYSLLNATYEREMEAWSAAKAQHDAHRRALTRDVARVEELVFGVPPPDDSMPLELAVSAALLLGLSPVAICHLMLLGKRTKPDS